MKSDLTRPALWGGLECTLNRVDDRFVDQCIKSRHRERLDDLGLFAELGFERLRYPCLWEWAAPHVNRNFDWRWADERLAEIQRLGLRPIVGFLHHGSGPRWTSLVDPAFPQELAIYARAFAQRFPWVQDYTPVNEPLTTARFAGLYGIWYPHGRDDRTFVRALYNQIKGTILAMAAIRDVRSDARLIQTEDLGRAESTPRLFEQRDFENERRWLTFDLLAGRVDRRHPLYKYLRDSGLSGKELDWLRANALTPDVLGLNHYLLSNRFLDHRLDLYPPEFHGGNGRERYADVGAIDTGAASPVSVRSLIMETHARYEGRPIALTEVHIRGYSEDRMRWFYETWNEGLAAIREGASLEAITAWSLLGTYDWNSLCREDHLFYEPGAFDLRAQRPRPTALHKLLKTIGAGERPTHPLLAEPGWWRTPKRVRFAPSEEPVPERSCLSILRSRPLLITGATGTLGRAFARLCEARGLPYRLMGRNELDIADVENIERVLWDVKPWAVINTAGYVRVDDAENDVQRCYRENVQGPLLLAQACAERGLAFLTFSSDLVFDGENENAYLESHAASPLNVYGRSKAECEEGVQAVHPEALIIRTSAFFGPWDEANFVCQTLKTLARKTPLYVASDLRVSPTYVPDLVHAALDLLIDGEKGIVHLANEGEVSWVEFAHEAVALSRRLAHPSAGDARYIVPRPAEEMNFRARRPKRSVLRSERLQLLPTLDDALFRYFQQLEVPWSSSSSLQTSLGGHP